MQLFYTPDIQATPELPEEEARHCIRVLRLGEGAVIDLTDGKGNFYKAVIEQADPKHCIVSVAETIPLPRPWPFYLHLAVAPTKNIDRIEWLAEKATETGIDAITFLNCRYSERRELKTERIEKILVSAMKQSLKATLPRLTGMTGFKTFIKQPFEGKKFIAHCEEGDKTLLKHACPPLENALILIGPEGDFSTEEIKMASDEGFIPVSLGESRLRTETAALTACQTIHFINQ